MMRIKTLFSSTLRGALALAVVSGLLVQVSSAEPDPNRTRVRRGFSLFSSTTLSLAANRVDCGITNLGELCVAIPGKSVGSVWPTGSANPYIFGAGLHVAGIVEDIAGFTWASDTVGAFFYDASAGPGGGQGDARSEIFTSTDATDVANWPSGAVIRANSVYNDALVGSNVISQQDSWVLYWDGNPLLQAGRKHPLGVMVEQRTLAWNFPAGNEDIIYIIYTLYNVSASDASVYAGLDPLIRDDIVAAGVAFQQLNEDFFGVSIPDGGYTFTELYIALNEDPDVGLATANSSTPIIPFDMGVAYKNDFNEPTWTFPPEINSPPFGPFPGFTATKYLQSPIDPATGQQVGLTLFSNTNNPSFGGGFPDPQSLPQMWRYLSGNATPLEGDNSCLFDPADKICFLIQEPTDTRFFQASGPLELAPGESQTIVMALVHGAPIAAIVLPFVGTTGMLPGIPATGAQLAADPTLVRNLELAAGWLSASDDNANGEIDQEEVVVVPRSLLFNALVAQTIFDGKFLLPFAPEQPDFFLVPGDNQVTVVWSRSVTETIGDPFFGSAGDPTSSLFDANYREFDVEGFRIYRGRTPATLELLEQFDYTGTVFTDRRGAWDYGDSCAPEIGIIAGCPVTFVDDGSGGSVDHALNGDLAQVLLPARVELATTPPTVAILDPTRLSNSVVDAGFPGLADTGVPFAFVDATVVNSNDYVYAVSAFDVNSFNSGPPSLESARVTKLVTPKAPASTQQVAVLVTKLVGDDGEALDPLASFSIDQFTGRFSGTPPPTDVLIGGFAPLVPQLLPALSLTATIDSLRVVRFDDPECPSGGNSLGTCYLIYGKLDRDGVETPFVVEQPWPLRQPFDGISSITTLLGSATVEADASSTELFGIPAGFSTFDATVTATLQEYIRFSGMEGQACRRGTGALDAGISPGGSRWFEGANETLDHPASSIRVGSVSGVDTIWSPIHHCDYIPGDGIITTYVESTNMQCFGYQHGGLDRQADIKFTWGPGGTMASVRDLTHHVDVQFKPEPQATYGFVGDNNGDGKISWRDFDYLQIIAFNQQIFGFCGAGATAGATAALSADPIIMAVSTDGNTVDTGVPTTGTGFGLYVAGSRFIFELTGGTPPPDGTEWTLRTYAGIVSASSGEESSAPSGYAFAAVARSPIIPGLSVEFSVTQATSFTTVTDSLLQLVHTVPDPYYVTSALEVTGGRKIIRFVNLPPRAIIRIYSVSGSLVDIIEHNDPTGGGEAEWAVRNRNEQFVASGVYFYHIEAEGGLEKIGRLTVVNQAQ